MSTAELSLNGLGCRLQICRRLAGVGVRFSLIGGLFAPRVSVCTRPPAPTRPRLSESQSAQSSHVYSLTQSPHLAAPAARRGPPLPAARRGRACRLPGRRRLVERLGATERPSRLEMGRNDRRRRRVTGRRGASQPPRRRCRRRNRRPRRGSARQSAPACVARGAGWRRGRRRAPS